MAEHLLQPLHLCAVHVFVCVIGGHAAVVPALPSSTGSHLQHCCSTGRYGHRLQQGAHTGNTQYTCECTQDTLRSNHSDNSQRWSRPHVATFFLPRQKYILILHHIKDINNRQNGFCGWSTHQHEESVQPKLDDSHSNQKCCMCLFAHRAEK